MTLVIGQDPYVGKIAGKYRLLQRLGAGGMGSVYLAEHVALPGSRRVVKVLSAEAQANEFVNQHFAVEARAAGSLGHPSIIAIEDLGALDTGEPYIAMEYLHGVDIHAIITRQGRLPFGLALQIILQACSALQCAHRAGIVHRDIKPHNLFFVDATGVVKVLDFGIAKAADPSVAGGVRTKSTVVSGSPGYMSPEQATGLGNVDARGDIFSLAATLFHMVTGELPFKAETFTDYVFQLGASKVPDPQALRPDLPMSWKHILLQALSVHVHERPQTAAEFALPLIADVPGGIDLANRYARDLIAGTPFYRSYDAMGASPVPSFAATGGGAVAALASGAVSGAVPIPSGTSISGAAGVVSQRSSTVGPRSGPWFAIGAIAIAGAAITVALIVTRGGSHNGSDGAGAAAGGGSDARTAATTTDAARAAQLEPPAADAAQLAAAPVTDAQLAAAPVTDAQLAALVPDAALAAKPIGGTPLSGTHTSAQVGMGSLEVYVEPWALVQIDGHNAGQTPVTKALTAGTHRVFLSNPDSGKQERIPVTIRPGNTTTIERKW